MSDTGGNPCVRLDNTYLLFKNLSQVSVPIPASPGALLRNDYPITTPLNPQWQIDIFGRVPSGTAESNNGIRLTSSTCGGSPGVSLMAEPVLSGTNRSGFYPHASPLDEDNATTSMRFLDSTPSTPASPGHPATIGCDADPSQGNGDRDLCEHIWSIYLTLHGPQSDPKHQADYAFRCVNGECEIEIGKPE